MSIPDFFAGQTVLMTGGTGFLGKVFLEKLLRCCPDISRIYLLVRPKKGLSAQERWKQLTNLELYDRLKLENAKALNKVVLMECNMKEKNLGLSKENEQELIENVTLIYHAAATVQFNNNIIDTLKENTRATYMILELAKLMKNLKVFQYVSTAYCNFNRPEEEWKEQVYPSPFSWSMIINLLETEESPLSILKDKILSGHPNAYTLSKNLAENVLQDYSHLFPIVIVRPSIITNTIEEPIPSWIDTLNGSISLCTGVALGFVRVIHANRSDYLAYIPADKAVNTMAVATRKAHIEGKTSGLDVYNCTMTKGEHVVSANDFSKYHESELFLPSKYAIWAPGYHITPNYWTYYILFLLKMVLPFTIVDLFLRISGKEPRLVKIAIKTMVATSVFRPFKLRQIDFPNEKYLQLEKCLQGKDKNDFSINIKKFNVLEEIHKGYIGVLKYYLKEEINEKTMKRNGERYRRLVILDRTLKVLTLSAVVWFAIKNWLIQKVAFEPYWTLITQIIFLR